jgi:hypothetical protein
MPAEPHAQTELPGLGQAAATHTSGGWLGTARYRVPGPEAHALSKLWRLNAMYVRRGDAQAGPR